MELVENKKPVKLSCCQSADHLNLIRDIRVDTFLYIDIQVMWPVVTRSC